DPEYQTEAQELISAIQAQERVTALAQNPLLCTIIAIIYRNNRVLPNRRVELYLKCCEALLDTWERNKDIKDSGLIGGFDWQTKLELLMPVAYWFHQHSEQLAMPEEAVVQQLAQALEELRKNSGLDSANKPLLQEAREFITAIRDRSGLLQGRGDGTLEFSHRTFQEYLAARYIAAQPDPVYIDIVMAHLHEAWWREVHLLVIGHLGSGRDNAEKATRLMLTILKVYKAPNRGLLYPKVWWWLRWFNPDKNWQDSTVQRFLVKWLLRFNLGTRLPRFQWQKRIAWHLMREFELVAQGYADCAMGARTQQLSSTVFDFSVKRISQWIYNPLYKEQYEFLLTRIAQQNLPRDAVIDIVLKALENKIGWVRYTAASSLGQLGQGNDSVIAALLKALQDEDVLVRHAAAESLGQLGQGNDSVISALLKALLDEYDWVRRAAAKSLAQLGQGNDSVIAALLKALQDEDDWVQRAAAESLCQLGQENDSVIAALFALQNENWTVRGAAASNLGKLGQGNDSVISALLKALQDENVLVRIAAAKSLGQLGQENDSVIAALLKALQDKDVRGAAAESLGQFKIEDETQLRPVLIALNHLLHDSNDRVRNTAFESLRKLLDGRPIPGYRWKPLAKREQKQKLWLFSLSSLLVLLIALFLVFQMPIVANPLNTILGIIVAATQLAVWGILIKEWLQK
ncbi:MAG: HEAT repeat domain-containing protein, partial [Candidatus Parabeggiatoa sp.]|nr:HEAT repeat domain-containing protein [Candidatus Parabeggiatoa sp.]